MTLIILSGIFVLLTLCSAKGADKHYCTEEYIITDIPGGIANEIYSMLTNGTTLDKVGCEPVKVEENLVKFLLYNRQNLNTPISLNLSNLNELDSTKPIIFQMHGWPCSYQSDKMPRLKNAYLSRYDANVIVMDWSWYSVNLYTTAFCYVPPIAEMAAKLICVMGKTLNIDINKIHVLGHSMGAHMAGLTGKEVKRRCGKTIGRITGLDPAGPLYQDISIGKRLYKTDASSVDVIHTNMGFLGYSGICGSSDFYPNCGILQPGCEHFHNISSIDKVLNLPSAYITCNHQRSIDYMIESIMNSAGPKFIGKNCDLVPDLPIIGQCGDFIKTRDKAEMGENCPANPPGRKFCLSTNSQPPFARG